MTIESSGEDGGLVHDPESRLNFHSSEIKKAGAWGIRVLSGAHSLVANTTVVGSALDGIIVMARQLWRRPLTEQGRGSTIEVRHCTVRNNHGVGISATAGGDAFVEENDLRGNTNGPFYSSKRVITGTDGDVSAMCVTLQCACADDWPGLTLRTTTPRLTPLRSGRPVCMQRCHMRQSSRHR